MWIFSNAHLNPLLIIVSTLLYDSVKIDWSKGLVSGAVYHGSEELTGLLCEVSNYMGRDVRKPILGGFVNNTGADQPAHPRSLISAFVIHFLESTTSRLSTSKIPIF